MIWQRSSVHVAAWLSMLVPLPVLAQTSAKLWEQYKAAPNSHPNIPNNSYAGYGYGESALPDAAGPIYDVTQAPYSADATGTADATEAIQAAIEAAGTAGGGVVFLPAGTYRIDGLIHLNQSHVVVRGEGADSTILDFKNSLETVVGSLGGGSSAWSWSGGLFWISPDDTFDGGGNLVDPGGFQGYERWRGTEVLASVTGEAGRGEFSVQVDSGQELGAGDMVHLSFALPADSGDADSYARHVYGDPATVGDFDWEGASWLQSSQIERIRFPVRIQAVDGNQVTFHEPLRTDIALDWDVRLESLGSFVTESGVEQLRIKANAPSVQSSHNQYAGHNGIYLNRGFNLWVNDVAVENTENGVITAAVKNVTVSQLQITGSAPQHHSIATRVGTVDTLFEDFRVEGPSNIYHGINTEGFGAGNVWSRGYMQRGTFDSHRLLPFDFMRTEIEMANDAAGGDGPANPGGSGSAGPFAGARAVHWNVDIFGMDRPEGQQGIWVLHPSQFPSGALVGIRGADVMPIDPTDPNWEAFGVPPDGASGTIVADVGQLPAPTNLYEAQLELRLASIGDGSGGGGDGMGGAGTGGETPGDGQVDGDAGASGDPGAGRDSGSDAGCGCRTAVGGSLGGRASWLLAVSAFWIFYSRRRRRLLV